MAITGYRSYRASRSVFRILTGLMVLGDNSANRKRFSRLRWALEVAVGALRGFVTLTGNLAMVRGVLLDPLWVLETLEAFRGEDLVATMMIE